MVCLDLSRIAGSDTLIALVMTCASAWMEAALADPNGGQRWVIYDEAWRLLRQASLLTRMQSQWKLSRALGIANLMVVAWLEYLWTLRDECLVSRHLRELVILRTAIRHGSSYEWHHHERMALEAGLNPGKFGAVAQWEDSDRFAAAERAVLALADGICDGAVSDEVWSGVGEHFASEELVEIVVTASAYVMVARVLDALQVPIEQTVEQGD
jgi:alkylhydroperoxidase family enzyme